MKKALVAYFSAGGATARLAGTLKDALGADVYEIKPEVPYTRADLNYMDKSSRSTIEMKNRSFRPKMNEAPPPVDEYDVIFVGFPIWWYVAPTIINTYLECFDLSGKTIVPFATSGGSGMGKTNEGLAPSCKGAVLKEGKVFRSGTSAAELKKWIGTLGL